MMRKGNSDFDRTTATDLQQDICDEIRAVLQRPDLSDEALREALDRGVFPEAPGLSLDDFSKGLGRPEERHRLIRSLAVPAPQHGLTMPDHDLNPPLKRRLAPLVHLWQRIQTAARAPMKQVPLTARNR